MEAPALQNNHPEVIPRSAIVGAENARRGAMTEPPKQQQVQIKADEKELLGQYSNLVVIHHNAEEFTLNFIYLFPTVAQGKLVASLIVSPTHAKRLMRALQENVSRFEAQFGTLPEGPGPGPEPNVGFIH
jgi:hypothetical protein